MADPVFPLIMDDTSPVVLYAPFADTFAQWDLDAGWNPFYTISGFATTPSGAGSQVGPSTGNGTSLHITSNDGGALQINWNGAGETTVRRVAAIAMDGEPAACASLPGTDITVFGTLIQPAGGNDADVTYAVALDGTPTTNYISRISPVSTVETASTDVLVSFTGLQYGPHSIQVTLHNPGATRVSGNVTDGAMLAFDRALVQAAAGKQRSYPFRSGIPTSSSNSSATAMTVPVPDDEIAYRGQWNYEPNLLPGLAASFHTSTNIGDRATLAFNGSAVGLTGLTTPASGAYNVSLDNEGPVTFSARASFTASAPTLLFFRTGLDPSTMHFIEVVNAGPDGAGDNAGTLLVLSAVNVTTVQSTGATVGAAASSGLSKGAIAALAIGVTLAVALAAAAVVFLRRRRRIARHKREMLVNPRINRAGRLSFLFPYKRHSHAASGDDGKALERRTAAQGVLDIRSPELGAREKQEESDEDEDGVEEVARHFSAVEKGKARALRRSNASTKNSDGSYSIELPDLTIAQVPRGYLPASIVPSTPSPPRTLPVSLPSPTSPRSTRPRGPREMQGRDSTRGILLSDMDLPPTSPDAEQEALSAGPSYLPDAHISPLRVEFASELQERPERRTERHVSTGTAVSLPQSLKQALSMQRASQGADVPSPTRPDPVFSFLDFNSSSTSTSLSRSQRQSASNSTGKSRASSQSMPNTGSEHSAQPPSVNWASLPPDRRISLGLSMTVAGGPTASRPSLSPSVLLQPVPLPPPVPALPTLTIDQHSTTSSESMAEPEGPEQPFPYDAAGAGGQLPSPTDSIPLTVSDIHFRHSTQSSLFANPESRRVSAQRLSGSHRFPHPPLPGAGSSGTSSPTQATLQPPPPRAHQGHQQQGSEGGSQTVPPFIVQRILGKAPSVPPGSPFSSPTTSQFASMTSTMSRAAMGAVASANTTSVGSTSPSSVPPTAPPTHGRGPSGGQAEIRTPGSGSTTTVFGFQLGRHR
ncbi:hypothetical protein BD413DRAFT_470817 [Trametes elegans]|nr:hypothetical protein BD413DRAFT_470817 [Trametes elegans]